MKLRLPDLSENAGEAVITFWHVRESEHIKKGQDLVEVATDKATFDVPAPCDGVMAKIFKKTGEEIEMGEVIAEIDGERGITS